MYPLPTNYDALTPRERRAVRDQYVEVQKGKCYHCSDPLEESPEYMLKKFKVDVSLFPLGFFNYPIHLHHNHDTGTTIGAVHAHCNAVLWQYLGE